MNFTLNIDAASIASCESALHDKLESLRAPVQSAMAEQYLQVVQSNFGPGGGLDRPWPWAPLSDRSAVGRAYIKKVGRTYATLFETGKMFATVRKDDANPEGATVSMTDSSDAPYATQHHYGHWPLPPRRVFPMRADGSCTDLTKNLVVDAARQALKGLL